MSLMPPVKMEILDSSDEADEDVSLLEFLKEEDELSYSPSTSQASVRSLKRKRQADDTITEEVFSISSVTEEPETGQYYFLHIKCGTEIKLIKIDMEAFDRKNILRKIAAAFPAFRQWDIIKTNLGAVVSADIFLAVIKQFMNSAAFYLEIERASEQHTSRMSYVEPGRSEVFINSKILEEHLNTNGFDYILTEYAEKNSISDASRRKVVNETVALLVKSRRDYPTREEKLAASRAIVDLFPCFDTGDPKKSIFFDPATNTGYLTNKLKNIRARRKNSMALVIRQENIEKTKTKSLNQEDYEFFKNCVLPSQRQELENRLKDTVQLRQKQRLNPEETLKIYPFYLKEPSLISFDFALRYPDLCNNLLTRWPTAKNAVKGVFRESGILLSSSENIIDWHSDVHPFFYLLKLLPPRFKLPNKFNIQSAIESIVKFEKSKTPKEEYILTGDTPYLIATGEDESTINKFILVVDKQILPLPSEFNMLKAFDLLFKTFIILNIDFPPDLSNFFFFFAKFFYELPNAKTNSRQQEIYLKLHHKLNEQ